MWSALFGSLGFGNEEKGILVLHPDPSAVEHVHGFKGGAPLRIMADSAGQTVHELLEKINKYRGPDQQILRVWSMDTGAPISDHMVVKGSVTALVKKESVS